MSLLSNPAPEQEAERIGKLQRVGAEGQGNAEARKAWNEIVAAAGTATLPRLLEAIDDSNPLAANWIRAAFETIAARCLDRGEALPAARFEAFLLDRAHPPRARRLAYEWLKRVDPGAEERFIEKLIDDPAVELRRDAVARLLAQAAELEKAGKAEALRDVLKQALAAARDFDQQDRALKKLKELGAPVDAPALFGFLRDWLVIGPFDNRMGAGFEAIHGPEMDLRLEGSHEGKSGSLQWQLHSSGDEFGAVDFNKILRTEKGVAAYAYTEFHSDADRDVEFRAATVNAWKLWVNGAPVFNRNEYHHGTRLDHYQARARLRAGKNLILLKVCQNEQTEDYAKTWEIQIRVCDSTGTAILPASRPALPAAGKGGAKPAGAGQGGR